MKDMLVRGLGANGNLMAFAATTTNLVDEAAERHGTSPTATAALGRTLTAALLMSATLKSEDMLTLRVNGDGPLGMVIATTNAHGEVRGYVENPAADLPATPGGKLDVGGLVGHTGSIVVVRDLGLKEPYTGTSEIISGEIAEDIANYYVVSEQTPSVVALGVLVRTNGRVQHAGGYIIQPLPGADEKSIAALEERVRAMPSVTQMITQGLQTPERILTEVLGPLGFETSGSQPVRFLCPCNKDRFGRILITLGRHELEHLAEQGHAELVCHFCREKYEFNRQELEAILAEATGK
jgi:molecular chaperone Hsp33